MALFGRLIKVEIVNGSGQAVTFDNVHISFQVRKSETEDSATIKIYNINETSKNLIGGGLTKSKLTLFAGYEEDNDLKQVYKGDVTYIEVVEDKPDSFVSIECNGGVNTKNNSRTSLSFSPGTSVKQVLNSVVKSFKGLSENPKIDISSVPDMSFLSGFSFNGSSPAALDKICKSLGLTWNIQNDGIKIYPLNGTSTVAIIKLSSESGLIGSPKRTKVTKTINDNPDGRDQLDGYEVKSLLLPVTIPGNRIEISSKSVSGVFKIISIAHDGDNIEADFISTIQVLTL